MKEIFNLYKNLFKTYLLLKSHHNFLWVIMLNLALTPWLGSDIEILIYTLFSINILSDIDENIYAIHTMLPINIKQRIKVIYLSTFTLNIVGILTSEIGYKCLGKTRGLTTSLTIFSVSIILSNLCYYYFCSSGFKLDITDQISQNSKLSLFISAMVLVIVGIRLTGFKEGLVGHMLQSINLMQKGMVISGLSIIVSISTYISYQHMVYVVRN